MFLVYLMNDKETKETGEEWVSGREVGSDPGLVGQCF